MKLYLWSSFFCLHQFQRNNGDRVAGISSFFLARIHPQYYCRGRWHPLQKWDFLILFFLLLLLYIEVYLDMNNFFIIPIEEQASFWKWFIMSKEFSGPKMYF